MPPYVAVVGAGLADAGLAAVAEEVGRGLAESGAVVLCGGLSGVMEAACRGCRAGGGTSVGILPGDDRSGANEFVDVALATGMGEMRNALIVRAADVVVALGGEYGTLSEIAFALKIGRPVVGYDTWEPSRPGRHDEPIVRVASAAEAVSAALRLADAPA
ncbi:MAG TPA: TIGR00725 family protein [Actinomycetota bacterium]|nr:TIGR00725 family protein [Actinomycetota bacterium]